MRFKPSLPSPAMCISLIALFVALSGSSYAAVTLHKNSVTSRTIRDGSIRLQDLNKTIRPAKSNRLFRAAVTDVVTDPASGVVINVKSEPGIKGDPGVSGAPGPAGPATVSRREAVGPDVGQGGQSGANAACLPGERVMGGGARFEASAGAGGAVPLFMQPTDGSQGYSASFTVTGPSTQGHARVFALCAS